MSEYLLRINNLSKSFSKTMVLHEVSLAIKKGSIHALLGENGAGKSTLMKCLFGIYKKDSGHIFLDENEVRFTDPKHSLEHGVSMVHQELNQILQRNVADNIWLGSYHKKGLFINDKTMQKKTQELFEHFDIKINPKQKLDTLSVSQRQMIEIIKAVSYNAKIIVLDEPTSSLTENETIQLFTILRTLKQKGIGIIYISHKLEEIFSLCDEVTILRDGHCIDTKPINMLTMDSIINMMVGRNLAQRFPTKESVPTNICKLKVENISTYYAPHVYNVSFDLHEGEILGIAGLVGSRRTELVEVIFGAREKETGTIRHNGKIIYNRNPIEAIKNGFALITEERRDNGIYPTANVQFNTTIANIREYRNLLHLLDTKQLMEATESQIKKLRIKTHSQKELMRTLSGGNQQKVIISRWLLCNPDILIMDEPTRGIDVGAKYEIYQLMLNIVKQKKSIIMVSSEMPELLGITNRIAVMSNGRLAGIVNTHETSQHEIFTLSTKFL